MCKLRARCKAGCSERPQEGHPNSTNAPAQGLTPVLCKGLFRLCRSRVASVTSRQPLLLQWESSHGQYVQESVICFPMKFYFWTLKFGFHIISCAMKCYYIILFIVSLISGD